MRQPFNNTAAIEAWPEYNGIVAIDDLTRQLISIDLLRINTQTMFITEHREVPIYLQYIPRRIKFQKIFKRLYFRALKLLIESVILTLFSHDLTNRLVIKITVPLDHKIMHEKFYTL